MRRIFLVLTVIALLTVAAMPAMADHRRDDDWRGHNDRDRHNISTFCNWYPTWWGWSYWCYSPWWGWWRLW